MRVLLTAPYVGEIGWELMSWQGRVRRIFRRGNFDRLVVLGARGKSAFYDDMPLDYVPVDLACVPGEACEDRRVRPSDQALVGAGQIRRTLEPLVDRAMRTYRARGDEVEVLWCDFSGTIYPCDSAHQTFIRYHGPGPRPAAEPSVLLVQRSRGVGSTNWSAMQWQDLADRLAGRGIHTSVYPSEASAAIGAASQCDLAVGQSTGGLHLASLCGCPHVVWSVGDNVRWTAWEMTNRQRYETLWNPLGTPVLFHATDTLPTPAQAADWVWEGLCKIGRRTGSPVRRFGFHRQWQFRDWLVRQVVRRPSFRRWPWPIQRFVRYGMI